MKPLISRIILLSSILLLLLAVPAGAAVPRLFEVKDDIVEPERTELKTLKAQLLLQKEALKDSVEAYNSRCRSVKEDSPDAYECNRNHAILDINVNNYAVSVHKFNRTVLNAPRIAPRKSTPRVVKKPVPVPKVVKKPVPTPKVVKKPAPAPKIVKKPAPAPRVVKKPVPAPKVVKKPAPAPKVVKKTVPAPKVVKKPAPAPRVVKKTVPVLRITNINEYLIIAGSKTADVRNNNNKTLDEMVENAKVYASNTAKMKKFKKVQQEIYKRRAVSLKQINKFSLRHMSEEMARLKQGGYYNDGDDLMEKERNDPNFRETVQEVLELRSEAEMDVHKRAMKEMRAAVTELRGE